MSRAKTAAKEEAVRLRVHERMSLREIQRQVGVSKSTLSLWLRDHPLTAEEKSSRQRSTSRTGCALKKDRGRESPLHVMLRGQCYGNDRKARISEAAVALRLALLGHRVFRSVADGDRVDFLVLTPAGRAVKLQVKWVNEGLHGLPTVSICHSKGEKRRRERYVDGAFDILVGYDLYTDTAYVFTEKELSHLKTCITIHADAAEAWKKLK